MAYEPLSSVRTYVWVLAALVVLTLATVAISFLPLPGAWHLFFGLSIGLGKASLVVVFFMELTRSPRLNWVVVAIALVWLICILMGLMHADYLSRGWIEGMPGH